MRPRFTLPIRWLLIGQFGGVILVTLVVVTLLMVYWRLPAVEAQQQLEQRRAAGIALLRVEANLELVERLARSLQSVGEQAMAAEDAASAPWRLPPLHPRDELLSMLWLDGEGRLLDLTRRPAPEGTVLPVIPPGFDLMNLPVLKHVLRADGLAWSDQYLSPVVGQPVVALALPFPRGFLVAELSVAQLSDSVSGLKALDDVTLLITDAKGEVVRSPHPEDRLHRRNLGQVPVIAEARSQGAAHGRLELHGTVYEGHALRLDRIGWIVYAGFPEPIAQASTRAAQVVTALTVGIAVLSGLLLNLLTATFIQRYLRRSIRYAEAVARGDYDQRPSDSRVTEMARLEQSLVEMADRIRQREQQLRAIVDLGPTVAIQIYDRETRVLEWNPASERILGFTREQALGRRPGELYYSPEQQAEFVALLRELERTGRAAGPYEGQIADAAGRQRWIYSTTFAIPGPTPDDPQFVCMDIDITEIKRLEEELRVLNVSLEEKVEHRTRSLREANDKLNATLQNLQQAQNQLVQSDKLAALGSLVAGVAHELNTPIGNALMAVSTLRDRLQTFQARMASGLRRSDLEGFVQQVSTAEEIAERNLHRAAELVSSFKQVAVDQTSSQRRGFDLAELVHEIELTLQPMLKRTPYTLEAEVPTGIRLDSYPGPLGQVLANLIQNAVLHGLEGRETGHIRLQAHADAHGVTLSVSDDGRGIPRHLHERIFDPFFTTKLGQGGSGLGLHIVHNIVTGILGGQIALESEPDQGTTFRLDFPRTAPREADTQAPTAGA